MPEPAGTAGGRKPGGGVSRAGGGGRRRGRKNKVRATPFPTRLYHHHSHSLPGRPRDQNRDTPARTPSPASGERPQARAAQYRQLRREGLKPKVKTEKKIIKAEKKAFSHNTSNQRCEQRTLQRQKGKCNSQHTKTRFPLESENLQAEPELANRYFHRLDKKPLASAENVRDLKPKADLFPDKEIDKEINYAGAKFSDPPSPRVLPKPPSHWMDRKAQYADQCKELMTYQLKALLKVQL
ncbi:proline-rich nuclear receptor coactivator 1 [Spea bombifrons]|uniref:proline-rich nuclear receptor coactivator 1 n=1 Tax=Spea bombifrons TaxID=233779 RepID=UPI00234B8173|nr:proline-rich nuclear receptor coactivator 1 [Spea bombifrons]